MRLRKSRMYFGCKDFTMNITGMPGMGEDDEWEIEVSNVRISPGSSGSMDEPPYGPSVEDYDLHWKDTGAEPTDAEESWFGNHPELFEDMIFQTAADEDEHGEPDPDRRHDERE